MRRKVRVAVVGIGNCASSLVQGVEYYQRRHERHAGLMSVDVGGYAIDDIEFSAAFDVNANKVGYDLAEAIGCPPNCTIQFATVPRLGVTVQRGPTLDGLGDHVRNLVPESDADVVNAAEVLRASNTDVVVSYLPVGAEKASEYYAEQAILAGCGMVNCVPAFIASNRKWAQRFKKRRLPIIGDDIKSQVGATITHRVLATLFDERGVRLDRTYQLNFGGNTDFLNMLDRNRLASKKLSKTRAVISQLGHTLDENNIHVGPSDYVPWLGDRKFCHIRMEGTAFGDVPISCEVKLEVWDSPNSAGVVVDAVRCIRLAMDNGIGGPLIGPSSYFMKSPPKQFTDHKARTRMEAFVRKYRRAESRA